MSGRGFTDPAQTAGDVAALVAIRRSLAARVEAGLEGGSWTVAGESHWLVVPDVSALVRSQPAFGVGFFGQSREDVDHTPILDLEQEVIAAATDPPGLLAYHNVRFATGQWGNLVAFASQTDVVRVRGQPAHLEALARTAAHYHSVRLHRLRFPGGVLGTTAPVLESTVLLDFRSTPPWRAVRTSERDDAGSQ